MVAVSPQRGVELIGGDGTEFTRECSVAVFNLELRLAGEVRYRPVDVGRVGGWRRIAR